MKETCRLLGFTRQAYYKRRRGSQKKQKDTTQALSQVLEIRKEMPKTGGVKLYHMLKEKGVKIGRDALLSLLREKGLFIERRRGKPRTTDSSHYMHKHPNLIRELEVTRPEQVWAADITYIDCRQRPLYLHLITDLYSRRIMGYALAENMLTSQTMRALEMALSNRSYPEEALIHHSDRGCQYCSYMYTDRLKGEGIAISMTENGNPYENAVAERINGILKQEFGLGEETGTVAQTRRLVEQGIVLYNEKRPHMSCQYKTPLQMHAQNEIKPKTYKKQPAKQAA